MSRASPVKAMLWSPDTSDMQPSVCPGVSLTVRYYSGRRDKGMWIFAYQAILNLKVQFFTEKQTIHIQNTISRILIHIKSRYKKMQNTKSNQSSFNLFFIKIVLHWFHARKKVIHSSHMFSKGDLVSLWQEHVCWGTTVFGDCTLQPNQSFLHQPSACDVVRMAVGVYYRKIVKASTGFGNKIMDTLNTSLRYTLLPFKEVMFLG